MFAVVQEEFGEPDVLHLKTVEKPSVKDHEVLIKVEAVSVNRADTLQRRGQYPPPAGVTRVLGLECAGHVARVGDKVSNDVTVGDRVMALLPGGGYAQYVAVHQGHVMKVPSGLDLERAAAIPEVWLTAYQLLHTTAGLRPGQTVLVHAGGSGVGTAAVQLIKLAGASAFVTAGDIINVVRMECKCRKIKFLQDLTVKLKLQLNLEHLEAAITRPETGMRL